MTSGTIYYSVPPDPDEPVRPKPSKQPKQPRVIKYVVLEFYDSQLAAEFITDVLNDELGPDITVRMHSPTMTALLSAAQVLAEEETDGTATT